VVASYSQQARITKEQYEQKADSVMSIRTIQKMQTLFTLTTQQQEELREATITLNRNRKAVFMEYRKTPALQEKMQQQEKVRDSVYQAIVGTANYAKYREAMMAERQQKQAAMAERMRVKFGTVDTVNNKPTTKPLN
jgi:hypothetical protein